MKQNTIVYQPTSLSEAQTLLKNNRQIIPIAGGTEFLHNQNELSFELPKYLLSLSNIKELTEITKTERYIDFGAMVTLQRIIELGEKNLPSILYRSLRTISVQNLRSLATIGGNIALSKGLKTLFPIMMTLDARVEVKTQTDTMWMPYLKYASDEFSPDRNKPHIITHVRLYDEDWSYGFFKRLGKKGILDEETAYFIFLIKAQKNLITDVHLCFAANKIFRNKEFENALLGHILPFSARDRNATLEQASRFCSDEWFTQKFHKLIFFNLLEKCLLDLS